MNMKTNKILLVLTLVVATFFTSCEEEKNVTYNGDQTLVSFVGSASTQPVVVEGTAATQITVEVSSASSQPRTIEVVAGENSTATPNQYTISNLTVPANSYTGTVTVAGNYDNVPQGGNFVLELKLVGLADTNSSLGSDTFNLTLFRFCPVQTGDYRIEMTDSYGDGWQTTTENGGAGMTATFVNASGAQSTVEFGLCSPYGGAAGTFLGDTSSCTANDGSAGTAVITAPAGTVDIIWSFPGDQYGEIGFKIFAPNGNQIYNSGSAGSQAAGELPPLVYCL